jgi:hypothetical protein
MQQLVVVALGTGANRRSEALVLGYTATRDPKGNRESVSLGAQKVCRGQAPKGFARALDGGRLRRRISLLKDNPRHARELKMGAIEA